MTDALVALAGTWFDVTDPDTAQETTSLRVELPATGTVSALRSLLERLDDRDVPVEQLEVTAPDLDDVFFALTTHPTRKALP